VPPAKGLTFTPVILPRSQRMPARGVRTLAAPAADAHERREKLPSPKDQECPHRVSPAPQASPPHRLSRPPSPTPTPSTPRRPPRPPLSGKPACPDTREGGDGIVSRAQLQTPNRIEVSFVGTSTDGGI